MNTKLTPRQEVATDTRCTITPAVPSHERYDRTPVRCVEDGKVYPSAAAAAHAIGCGRSAMSSHLSGRFPHLRGKHFERVEGSVDE